MALSLTAEQKNIKNLFVNEDVYIIPVYQRPYSWTNEHCIQLYNDITEAYQNQQDYFVGNLVFARADNEESNPNLIDGQQRIITIWLFLKALSLLLPDMKILNRAIKVESWEGNNSFAKVCSHVPPYQDDHAFRNVLSWNQEIADRQVIIVTDKRGKIKESICNTHVEANFICIYSYLSQFYKNIGPEEQKKFLTYFMTQVYLLPIDLKGKSIDDATNKALSIFETLNNRGLNLEDADIFKANLYKKAESVGKSKEFIGAWSEIVVDCSLQNISLDDLFRYYSHIIRGTNNIISKETRLRDFFINEPNSPLNKYDYEDVIKDLQKILFILRKLAVLRNEASETSAWLRIIDAYSNAYPQYAIVAYLYKNIDSIECSNDFLSILKKLVRLCYSVGSSTAVKFMLYVVIGRICNNSSIDDYYQMEMPDYIIDKPGRLKKGLVLLDHRLRYPNELGSFYEVDVLLRESDFKFLPKDWNQVDKDGAISSLVNHVVISISKKNVSLPDKQKYYSKSLFVEAKDLLAHNSILSYKSFECRRKNMKQSMTNFFTGKEA